VHLTWENEAHQEVKEARGALEIVYPPASIKAEPYVTWVDANVKRKGTKEAAEAYLKFLYTEPAQEIIARHGYRPTNPDVRKAHAQTLRPLELFEITRLARDWDDANDKFFADGGIFDVITEKSR
jgi:sulfate transport system substrate-binding protein